MRRQCTVIVMCFLIMGILSSCSEDSSTNPTGGHTVTGQVVDSNGNGVGSISVKLSGASKTYTATTSENGIYTKTGVAEGLYLLSCQKNGYFFTLPYNQITVDDVITISNITARTISLDPTPSDGSTDIPPDSDLSWSVYIEGKWTSPNNYTYDVRFGTSIKNLTNFSNGSSRAYDPNGLEVSKQYYWQVIVKYNDNIYESPIWNFTTSKPNIEMVSIPFGSFQMGDIHGDGDIDERPIHTVYVSSFEISMTEITQGLYREVMGSNPSNFKVGDNFPVEQVSWFDAAQFCNRLSDFYGFDHCYSDNLSGFDINKNGFRLPTEAEWEYACRAGTESKYYSGDDKSDLSDIGWFSGNSNSTHPVGQKIPNAWGIYDMHGNVFEWVNDWYWSYSAGNQTNPTGPTSGSYKIRRGGGWIISSSSCSASFRGTCDQEYADDALGFRVVRRP